MAENNPKQPDSKLGLIGPASVAVVAALIVLGAVFLQRTGDTDPDPVPTAAPAPAPASEPIAKVEPVAEKTGLDRQALIDAATQAAASYASGETGPSSGKTPLTGRRFRVRIPFGCEGPQVRPGNTQAYYEVAADTRSVRLVARPAVWTTLPLIQDLDASGIEAVEGFWIPHPWSASDGCPQRREGPVPAAPTPAAAQTLGLATLFDPKGSRVGRRGERPYEHVLKLGENEKPPLAQGYRLVLEGRFGAFPTGQTIQCWAESPDHRPICLFAVQLERVAFEGSDAQIIAEWTD